MADERNDAPTVAETAALGLPRFAWHYSDVEAFGKVTLDRLRKLPDGSLTREEVNLLIDYIERLEGRLLSLAEPEAKVCSTCGEDECVCCETLCMEACIGACGVGPEVVPARPDDDVVSMEATGG